eukprot:8118731-Pyramimonas_sp.AAC.1
MPMADLVLSPNPVQPVLHLIWGCALASQSSFRATNKAMYCALWIFFLRLILLGRVFPQTIPPRAGV